MMVFKCPGSIEWEGITYDFQMVPEGDIPDGWHATVFEAQAAANHPADLNDSGDVTRAELEQKAKELGLTFHHRTGDKKLLQMIEEALK